MSAFGQGGSGGRGRENNVYVGNLEHGTTQGDLEAFFDGIRVVSVRLVHDKETGEPKGYGYVEFADKENQQQALQRNGNMCVGRALRVDMAVSRQQRQQQGGGGGGYNNRNQGYNNRNQGFNQGGSGGGGGGGFNQGGGGFNQGGGGYNSQQSAFGGQQQGGGFNQGRQQQDYQSVPVPDSPPFTAFVGNFTFDSQEQDIVNLFEGLAIEQVRIVFDRESNQSRGYSYVEFGTKQDLTQALTFNGHDWNGRALRVNVAPPKGGMGGRGNNSNSAFGGGNQQQFNQSGSAFGNNDNRDFQQQRGGGFGQQDRGQGGFSRGGDRGQGGFGGNNSYQQQQGSNAFSNQRRQYSQEGGGQGGYADSAREITERMVDTTLVEPTQEDELARPRLNLTKRTSGTKKPSATAQGGSSRSSNVFGGAKAVDQKEILARLEAKNAAKEAEAKAKAAAARGPSEETAQE